MLHITIPKTEWYNEKTQEFITLDKNVELVLEHSLVSISKWESKWHKAFFEENDKSPEEMQDYVKCMTLTQNIDPEVYKFLTRENYDKINEYIADPMTATTFWGIKEEKSNSKKKVTSEEIYSNMISLQIPFECQKWHINRLLTLIKCCNVKNQPAKKMSKTELMARNKALNASRKAKHHTRG